MRSAGLHSDICNQFGDDMAFLGRGLLSLTVKSQVGGYIPSPGVNQWLCIREQGEPSWWRTSVIVWPGSSSRYARMNIFSTSNVGNWSGSQLRSGTTITFNHGTDDDNGGDDLYLEYKKIALFLHFTWSNSLMHFRLNFCFFFTSYLSSSQCQSF